MGINARDVLPNDPLGRKTLVVPLSTAVAQINRPAYRYKPGHPFRLLGVQATAALEAGAVSCDVVIAGPNDILTALASVAQSAAPTTSLAVGGGQHLVGGVLVNQAAVDPLAFTAVHVITANLFGAILLQVDAAGTLTTKVSASPQAHLTAIAALAALPAADAGNVAVAHLVIQAGVANWTANTTAVTGGASFAATILPARPRALVAPLAFATATRGEAAAAPARLAHRGSKDDEILVLYTSDGIGALTNGVVTVEYRPMPMNGEGSFK